MMLLSGYELLCIIHSLILQQICHVLGTNRLVNRNEMVHCLCYCVGE